MIIDWAKESKEKLLKECNEIRKRFETLKELTDEELIVYALIMYKRRRTKIQKNKDKKLRRNSNV